MLVSVVIPALNEARGICKVLSEIPYHEFYKRGYQVEVIVVDGGSVDGTAEIAKKMGAKVVLELRRGYGRAYKTGFLHARGDIIITGDADGQYPFNIIHKLVDILLRRDLEFITTNRFYSPHSQAWRKINVLGNKILTLVFNLIFRTKLRDCQSGMWVIRRRLLDRLSFLSNGMEFSIEIKAKAIKNSRAYLEVPIEYRQRVSPNIKLRIFRDGLRNLLYIFYLGVYLTLVKIKVSRIA